MMVVMWEESEQALCCWGNWWGNRRNAVAVRNIQIDYNVIVISTLTALEHISSAHSPVQIQTR